MAYGATLAGIAAIALWAFMAPLARLAQPMPTLLLTGLREGVRSWRILATTLLVVGGGITAAGLACHTAP